MSDVTYKIRVNRPCRLYIDDEEVMSMEESRLTKITLPEGEYLRKVVAIDNSAIYDEAEIVLSGSSKLDDITLDTIGLEEAKRNALPISTFKMGDLYFKPSRDRLSIEVVSNKDDKYMFENVNIPEKIVYAGCIYPITGIGTGAFSDCSSLTSITIPNSVMSIGFCAFGGCSALTSVTIPDSVTHIGDWAFDNCSSLTTINYAGSKEQWEKIEKGNKWYNNSKIQVIRCTLK